MAIPRPTSPLFRSLSVSRCGCPACRAVRHQRPGGPRCPLPLGADDLRAGDGTAEGVQRAVREGHGAVQRRSDPAHQAHGPVEDRIGEGDRPPPRRSRRSGVGSSSWSRRRAARTRSGRSGRCCPAIRPATSLSQASIIDVVSSRRAAVLAEASKASAAAAKARSDAKAAPGRRGEADPRAGRPSAPTWPSGRRRASRCSTGCPRSERQAFLDSQAAPVDRAQPERDPVTTPSAGAPTVNVPASGRARQSRSRRPSPSSAARTCGPPPDRPASTAPA